MAKAAMQAELARAIKNGWTYTGLMSGLYQAEYDKTREEMQSLCDLFANKEHYVFLKSDKSRKHPIRFEAARAGMKKKIRKKVAAKVDEPKTRAEMQRFFSEYCRQYKSKCGRDVVETVEY